MNKVKIYYNVVMRALGYMLPAFIFGVLSEAITAVNFLTDRGFYTGGVLYTIAILMLYITGKNDIDDVQKTDLSNYEEDDNGDSSQGNRQRRNQGIT